MRNRPSATFAVALLLLIFFVIRGAAQAQTIFWAVRDVALKSGESTELADIWWINHSCKSMLKATPEVEILDGPPGVTAVINPAKVVPRTYSCAKPVAGGKLVITAKDIQEHSYTRMVLRINYKTLNGDRERSESVNIALFPPN